MGANDYFYSHDVDLFIFYRIPKALFAPRYSDLDCEAKVLYGLLLDRNSLSIKNNWVDKLNRVYIYFERSEAEEMLGVKKEKAIKLFKELQEHDLIEDVRQGRGNPNRIYVKKAETTDDLLYPKKSEKQTSVKQTSRVPKSRHAEVGKTDCNNIYLNDSELKDNNQSDQFDRIDDMINYYSDIYGLPFQSVLNVFDRCSRQQTECNINMGFTVYFEAALKREQEDYKVTRFIINPEVQ